jgi:signal transduction histidine kinase
MGNMEKSFNNYLQCNIEANSIGHMSMQMDSYYYLSKISAKKQKFSDAYQFYTHYVAIKDSITNQDKNNKIAEIEIRYATEKKDNQIILLNERARIQKLELARRNQWVLFISVFALLLFIISVLVYWFRTFKTKQLLLNAILETENAERLRIAKDMHDELGSGFSKIQLFAEVARQNMENPPTLEENIGRISVSAKELADNMRDLIWTMNPENSTLDNLVARLREYCADFLDEFPIDYTLNFQDDIPKTAILQDAQRNIYLTLKEALNNTIKHAQANSIVIALSISGSLLTLNITDDGNGFDMGKIKKNGNGLVNMAERIRKINGTFQLTSNPGKGTDITFTINTNKSS